MQEPTDEPAAAAERCWMLVWSWLCRELRLTPLARPALDHTAQAIQVDSALVTRLTML